MLIAQLQEAQSFGDRVTVFQNDSTELARAVWSAAPLLRQAVTVNICTVGKGFNPRSALTRIIAVLNRTGHQYKSPCNPA